MTEIKIDNRKDFLLLMLYSSGKYENINEPIVGRTRLIKLMFLFMKEGLRHFTKNTLVNEQNFYEFIPWNFGPFSKDIYDDLTFFILRGYIEANNIQGDVIEESAFEFNYWIKTTGLSDNPEEFEEYQEQEFLLTKRGIEYASNLYNLLTNNQKEFLKLFKLKFNSAPLRGILRYVYKTYPEYAVSSIIQEDLFD